MVISKSLPKWVLLKAVGHLKKIFTQWWPMEVEYFINKVMTNYFNQENNREPGVGFHIYLNEIFEVQFDGVTNEMIFRKSNVFIIYF